MVKGTYLFCQQIHEAKCAFLGDVQRNERAVRLEGLLADVKRPGQAVKKGDVLMVLEAMKMENEIMCPRDGVVASVNTSKGASVESGTLLCVLQ